MTDPTGKGKEREEEKKEEEIQDLIQLFTKPVAEMSDEELDEALSRMSKMRKTKISSRKKVDYVTDVILPKLDPAAAEQILKKLEAADKEEDKESEEEKETESE